jgi:hypothetical protein
MLLNEFNPVANAHLVVPHNAASASSFEQERNQPFLSADVNAIHVLDRDVAQQLSGDGDVWVLLSFGENAGFNFNAVVPILIENRFCLHDHPKMRKPI